jgi:hypothetical protein
MSQHLAKTFAELEADLLHEDGPRISTMRNYRYCMLVYPPRDEYKCRLEASRLTSKLCNGGWVVKSISLQALLLRRLEAHGDAYLDSLVAREKAANQRSPDKLSSARGLNLLRQKIEPELEGSNGLAADVIHELDEFVAAHPDQAERTLVLLGRAAGLYPFFSASALLKLIDGRTHNIPVVMLYPGVRHGDTGLSFMGQIPPHTDYRPRIYG